MYRENSFSRLISRLQRRPDAVAFLRGDSAHPALHGSVRFDQTPRGVLVAAEIFGLPTSMGEAPDEVCQSPVFGFHIHDGGACAPTEGDPFGMAGSHYNPQNCPHPHHAGDLPPLFGANGCAFTVFLSGRFTVDEIIGRTVIIHSAPDDFTTQPAGNAGSKIACGVITRL